MVLERERIGGLRWGAVVRCFPAARRWTGTKRRLRSAASSLRSSVCLSFRVVSCLVLSCLWFYALPLPDAPTVTRCSLRPSPSQRGDAASCHREDSKEFIAHVKTEVRPRAAHRLYAARAPLCGATASHVPTLPKWTTQGIKQFLHIWATKKDIRDDVLKWGDEVGPAIVVVQLPTLFTTCCLCTRSSTRCL